VANPQPEPFVKFSKELFDALLLSAMPATHKEIVLAIIRRTYGDHGKKVAPISHSLIRRMTGRADSGIRKSMSALSEEGVLIQVQPPNFRQPALWRLNKDYETWGRWSVRSATVVAEGQELADCHESGSGECHHGGRGDRQSLAEGSATTVAPLKTLDLEKGETRAPAREETPPVDNLGEGGEDPTAAVADRLIRSYLKRHKDSKLSLPTKGQRDVLRAILTEKLAGGASEETIGEAIRRLVAKGKPPSHLPSFITEVEAEGSRSAEPSPEARERNIERFLEWLRGGVNPEQVEGCAQELWPETEQRWLAEQEVPANKDQPADSEAEASEWAGVNWGEDTAADATHPPQERASTLPAKKSRSPSEPPAAAASGPT
jgi:hypothetical protein